MRVPKHTIKPYIHNSSISIAKIMRVPKQSLAFCLLHLGISIAKIMRVPKQAESQITINAKY